MGARRSSPVKYADVLGSGLVKRMRKARSVWRQHRLAVASMPKIPPCVHITSGKDSAIANSARAAPRLVHIESCGRFRIESAELPGRRERLIIVRGFAAHVPHGEALAFAKGCYWGYDAEAEDMQLLTQWKHIDWPALDRYAAECADAPCSTAEFICSIKRHC